MHPDMAVHAPDSAHDFAAQALGVLLERVGSAAGDLGRLRAALDAGVDAPQEDLPGGDAPDLARSSEELERLGWLFGLLARELGSDVLFERRERSGLDATLWLVGELLSREGISLALPPLLPALDAADPRCSTLCAVVARCVHAAHVDDPHARWSLVRQGQETLLHFEGAPGAALERALREGLRRVPGVRLSLETDHGRLSLPQGSAIWP